MVIVNINVFGTCTHRKLHIALANPMILQVHFSLRLKDFHGSVWFPEGGIERLNYSWWVKSWAFWGSKKHVNNFLKVFWFSDLGWWKYWRYWRWIGKIEITSTCSCRKDQKWWMRQMIVSWIECNQSSSNISLSTIEVSLATTGSSNSVNVNGQMKFKLIWLFQLYFLFCSTCWGSTLSQLGT